MSILVVGSGVAGSIIGSRLTGVGHEVTFVTSCRRQRQLMTRGLFVRSPLGTFRRPMKALAPNEPAGLTDFVFVCTRACDYENALALAASAIGPNTIVVPVIEGIAHLDALPTKALPRLVVGVLEVRAVLDGDGVVNVRTPTPEMSVGAIRSEDVGAVEDVCKLLTGRGVKVRACPRIRARAFERFTFMAAAIATTVTMRCSLRDSRHFATGTSTFENMLAQGYAIGKAAGYGPDEVKVRAYKLAYLLEGRPVQVPPLIEEDGGRGSDEATFLLGEMTALAGRVGKNLTGFERAWRRVTGQGGFFQVANSSLEA